MEPIQVAVVNQTSLKDEDVAQGMAALQKQVSGDFAPVWHVDAHLHLVKRDCATESHPNSWGLILLDGEADARQLGYHDLTRSGLPLSRVFVNRIPKDQDWTHAASHELLEMLADPDINTAIYSRPDAVTLFIYAREVCDPCAAYADGYDIDDRRVSDFTFPAWFQADALTRFKNPTTRTRFDERGRVLRAAARRVHRCLRHVDQRVAPAGRRRGTGRAQGDGQPHGEALHGAQPLAHQRLQLVTLMVAG